jgi:hypothetical protein
VDEIISTATVRVHALTAAFADVVQRGFSAPIRQVPTQAGRRITLSDWAWSTPVREYPP